jgi:hypothetical protein
MTTIDRPRVLLLWPGGVLAARPSFGVPQLLNLAQALRLSGDVHVDVVDLDMERALGPVSLADLCAGGYDLVGISCYSSYDYLKVMAIAQAVRALLPDAWLVTGGYHASARPQELLTEDSAFDYVVVGDGEPPLQRLVRALAAGKRPLARVLGPESLADPSSVMPYDWSLLARYLPVMRRVASQVELYLARGCPYDCSFCMERAKRDTSWRAVDALTAVEELHRADQALDLRGFSLRIPDPLFGMKNDWRMVLLVVVARRPFCAVFVWLVLRAVLLVRVVLGLLGGALVAVGFGVVWGVGVLLVGFR